MARLSYKQGGNLKAAEPLVLKKHTEWLMWASLARPGLRMPECILDLEVPTPAARLPARRLNHADAIVTPILH